MSDTTARSTSRNRRLLEELLSTQSVKGDETACLLVLAEAMESAGLRLIRWTMDGPSRNNVRVEFHSERDTVTATLAELSSCATALAAGHPAPWRALVMPEGSGPSAPRGGQGRTHGMQITPPRRDPKK